jgi:hypothetical protein
VISRREALLGSGLLFLLINVVFAPFLWGDRSTMSSSAETASIFLTGARPQPWPYLKAYKELDPGAAGWQTEPEFVLEHRLLIHGSPPLWNPYVGFGQPLSADMLSQPYYPLTWIVEANPSVRIYNWYIAMRFWIAALFAFLFLGYYVGLWPALAGGVGYGFTGYLVIYYDIAHLSVEVLIPALLWGIERLVRRRDWSAAGSLALVIAAVVFGGMPESAILAFAFALAFGIVRLVADPVVRPQGRAIAARGVVAVLVGVLTSSVLTLPFLEFLRVSFSQHPVTGGTGLVADGWDLRSTATYLAPLIYGPPWNNIFQGFAGYSGLRGYWGVAATYFALVAIFSLAADRLRRRTAGWSPEAFFAIAAAVLLLKRFGVPLVNWIGALPGFAQVYFAKYEEPLTGFCVAALAAFGVARLVSGRSSRFAVTAAALAILAVLTVDTALVKPAYQALTEHRTYLLGAVAWALVVLATAFALSWSRMVPNARFDRRWVGWTCALLVTIDLLACFFVPMWYVVNEAPPMAINPVNGAPFVAYVQQQTQRSHERFLGLDGLLYPEWASAFGIVDVRDLNALYTSDYMPFVRDFFPDQRGPSEMVDRFTGTSITHLDDPLARRFLALGSVRFVAAKSGSAVRFETAGGAGPSPFSLVSVTPEARVLRFADPLPRVALYSRVVGAADLDAALTTLATPAHEIRQVGVVTTSDPDGARVVADLTSGPATPVGAGTLERYESDDVVASVDAASRSLAVLNDTDYPGWKATVDGRAVPIVRANALFRGVEVPPGRHTIEFRYRPLSFVAGLTLSVAGLTIALALSLGALLIRFGGGRSTASGRI